MFGATKGNGLVYANLRPNRRFRRRIRSAMESGCAQRRRRPAPAVADPSLGYSDPKIDEAGRVLSYVHDHGQVLPAG